MPSGGDDGRAEGPGGKGPGGSGNGGKPDGGTGASAPGSPDARKHPEASGRPGRKGPQEAAGQAGKAVARGTSEAAKDFGLGLLSTVGLLDPALLDILTRLYGGSNSSSESRRRWQDRVIVGEIPPGAYVLDLGCGRGELMDLLIKESGVHGQAVEVDPEAAMAAMELGVPVLNMDLADIIGDFNDRSFDFVILESTIQTLKEPLTVLDEMLRVGKRGIVSFPNFGHWRLRFDLAATGRMPVSPSLPYEWYNTPNIRVLTFTDFMDWARSNNVTVSAAYGLHGGHVTPITEKDNLVAEEVLLFIERD